MAIGTITLGTEHGAAPSDGIFMLRMSFPGDSAYTTGGTLLFEASVRAAAGIKKAVEIIDVISGDCGDHHMEYLKATGALKMRVMSTGAEVAATTDKSGTTVNITVICR